MVPSTAHRRRRMAEQTFPGCATHEIGLLELMWQVCRIGLLKLDTEICYNGQSGHSGMAKLAFPGVLPLLMWQVFCKWNSFSKEH